VTPGFVASVLAGVVIGKILVHLASRLSRRMGWTQALEARLEKPLDRAFDAIAAGVTGVVAVARSEITFWVIWVVVAVVGGSAFVLGMSAG
jgi:hypothetical protein